MSISGVFCTGKNAEENRLPNRDVAKSGRTRDTPAFEIANQTADDTWKGDGMSRPTEDGPNEKNPAFLSRGFIVTQDWPASLVKPPSGLLSPLNNTE